MEFRIHAEKDYYCFYKNSTNQTFTFISSNVVYFKKYLTTTAPLGNKRDWKIIQRLCLFKWSYKWSVFYRCLQTLLWSLHCIVYHSSYITISPCGLLFLLFTSKKTSIFSAWYCTYSINPRMSIHNSLILSFTKLVMKKQFLSFSRTS